MKNYALDKGPSWSNMEIRSVVFGEGVLSIGNYGFYYHRGLKSITIPTSIKAIGTSAFEGCYNLELVTIEGQLEAIKTRAFFNCTNLATFKHREIAVIEENVFTNTKVRIGRRLLESMNLDNSKEVTDFIRREASTEEEKAELWIEVSKKAIAESEISTWEEEGDIEWGFDEGNGRLVIKGKGPLEDYKDGRNRSQMNEFDEEDDEMSPWMQKYRDRIQSAVICLGVSSIGSDAFSDCSSLKSVVIPDGLTSIGDYAFWGCKKLTSIYFPESVSFIG